MYLYADTVLCGPDNGGCEQLCLLSSNRMATCVCANGYMLTENNQNCTGMSVYVYECV